MTMKPRIRKLALTTHVSVSVGWIGAVAAFLVLSIAALVSADAEIVRGAYLSMNLIGWYMIVPASFAALGTGLLMALGTPWGLIRYYWVFSKFLLVSVGAFLLLLHQFVVVQEAAIRASTAAAGTLPNVGPLGTQLVTDAFLAILLLLMATALAVYKPWGPTRYGRRSQRSLQDASVPFGLKLFVAGLALVVVVMLVLHATGHNPVHHGM